MSEKVVEAAGLMDMLPEADPNFAYEFIKKSVRAWDPDFTKATPQEAREMEEAEASGFVDEKDIDWGNLSQVFRLTTPSKPARITVQYPVRETNTVSELQSVMLRLMA